MSVKASGSNIETSASGKTALQSQEKIVVAHFRNVLIMRLGLYALAAILVIIAALLVVFAPSGRETLTGVIAFALFALSVGAAGFGTFSIKTPLGNVSAGPSHTGDAVNKDDVKRNWRDSQETC